MLKKIFGQLHLWLGLCSGLVVLVVTVTGAIMVFEDELEPLLYYKFYHAEQVQAARLPLDRLKQQAETVAPVVNITMETDAPDRNVVFSCLENKVFTLVAVDPYTGRIAGQMKEKGRFFDVTEDLHRRLLAGDVGKAITGVSCLIFLFLVLSGIVLWWPKKWKGLKQRLQVKTGGSTKRMIWDLHAVGGFYVHLLVFAMAFTGLTWSYRWFNNGIFLVFDGKPQQRKNTPDNGVIQLPGAHFYENLYNDVNRELPYRGEVRLNIPLADSLSITVSKRNDEASVDNVVDFLFYEKGTGRLLEKRLYKDETTGMKVRRLVLPVHSGSIYGWPTKIVAFAGCLFAVSLPVTGFLVWWNRKKKKPKGAVQEVKASADGSVVVG